MKEIFKKTLQSFGLSIQRYPKFRSLPYYLKALQIQTTFDAGANEGGFGQQLRACGYRGKIISFEPVGSVFMRLKTTSSKDPLWECHNIALGEITCSKTINVANSSLFSSILTPGSEIQSYTEGAKLARQEKIQVQRLDEWIQDKKPPAHNWLLKSDTQGYEKNILAGAENTLPQITALLLELPVIPLYQTQATLCEITPWLKSKGFAFRDVIEVNIDLNKGDILEMDCLFVNYDKVSLLGKS